MSYLSEIRHNLEEYYKYLQSEIVVMNDVRKDLPDDHINVFGIYETIMHKYREMYKVKYILERFHEINI